MSNVISLQMLAQRVEDRGDELVRCGTFESFADFKSYYDIHYKPILLELEKEWAGADGARRFLAGDLLAIFGR